MSWPRNSFCKRRVCVTSRDGRLLTADAVPHVHLAKVTPPRAPVSVTPSLRGRVTAGCRHAPAFLLLSPPWRGVVTGCTFQEVRQPTIDINKRVFFYF